MDFDFLPSDGGYTIASADNSGSVWLWRDDETPIRELRAHHAGVWSVRFSPDGSRLLTGSMDGTARIWPVVMPEER